MSDWHKITPTSPTEEEAKRGIVVGNWDKGPLTTHWDTFACFDRNWSSGRTHWIEMPTPPPRPDPEREACENALKKYPFYSDVELMEVTFAKGFSEGAAWQRGQK